MATRWSKNVSLPHLSIDMERRRILNSRNANIMTDTLTTAEFWKIVEDAFIRPRNIKFDRYVFLIKKQLRVETIEHFMENLKN